MQELRKVNNYSRKDTIRFFTRFIARSFMISILFIVCGLLVFASVIVGDVIYNAKNGNNVVPLFGGYIIITPSMVPTIKINDAVVVKRVEDNELKIGDIITFKSADARYTGLTVTHRVVGSQKISSGDLVYRTKGDNNKIEDSAVVDMNSIYGKVVLKLPKLALKELEL